MRELHRRLPPLAALVAFEAAGRHGNFTRAARELCVSQAAVSRRIRELEEHLGITLFQRLHRAVALTQAGARLHQAVGYGLDQIHDAIAELQRSSSRPLAISANNAVAFYWLRPRVPAFQRVAPEIELAVFASDVPGSLLDGDVDLGIRYGDGHWADAEASPLFEEAVFPVCAPAYLARHGPLRRPADLLGTRLLYMYAHGPDWVTWAEWLRVHGVETGDGLPAGPTFDSYPVLLQAALDGQGMAIGTRHLVDSLLAEGRLVQPFPGDYRTGRGYFVVTPAGRELSAAARRFRDWILAEAG